MSKEKNAKAQNYQNVMEILVNEEIDRQLQHLSENLLKYINRIEVATYALNRLPPLYASCQEGLAKQKQQAKKYRSKIHETVRQALAAVQRDPIRLSTPLMSPEEVQYEQTLRELIDLLPQQTDARRNALELVRHAIATPTPVPQRQRVPSQPIVSHRDQIREQLRTATGEHPHSQKAGTAESRQPSRQAILSHRDQIREQLRITTAFTEAEAKESGKAKSLDWTDSRYHL
ncbi:MAG: late competence development ComFB family protein [Limnospira sp.]